MNDRTTESFHKFSKSITICIINRFLGIISVLLIIASFLFLALCFWLLTGSKYIENNMNELCKDVDFSEFKNMVDEYISSISNTVNSYIGYPFIPKTEIKREFKESLKSHVDYEIDTDSSNSEFSSSSSTSDVEIVEMSLNKPIKTPIDLTNEDPDSSDTKTTCSYKSLPEAMDENYDVTHEKTDKEDKKNENNSEEYNENNSEE